MSEEKKEYLNVLEAAEYLGLGTASTIYHYLKIGKLTRFKRRGNTFISRKELEELLTIKPVT